MPTLDLRIRDSDSGTSFEFGEIQSIQTTYQVSMSGPTPIVIYGYEHSLVLDKGVTKTYYISFTRVNPMNPSNVSETDSSRWTNAHWVERIKAVLANWQVYTNGYRLDITMPDGFEDLYPELSGENVYISGLTIPYSNKSSQYISGTLSLTTGSLTTDDAEVPEQYDITFYLSNTNRTQYFTVAMPAGSVLVMPNPKATWVSAMVEELKFFFAWQGLSGYSGQVSAGDNVTVTGDMSFYGIWLDGVVTAYLEGGDFTHTLRSDATYVSIYLAGGGGGGNMSGVAYTILTEYSSYCGGGGGAGANADYGTFARDILPDEISFHVGNGGAGGQLDDDGNDVGGQDGESTYFNTQGILLNADGGAGSGDVSSGMAYVPGFGDRGYDGGYGGIRNYTEEDGWLDPTDAEPGDGDYGGATGSGIVDNDAVNGGGGGSVEYDAFQWLFTAIGETPYGGDGGYSTVWSGSSPGGDGYMGCGGGGGARQSDVTGEWFRTDGGKGGDGFVIFVEYTS